MRVWSAALVLAACSFEHGALPRDSSVAPPLDTPVDVVTGCRATYPATHGTSRYRTGVASWYQAEMMCEADGAHLVVIDNDLENQFVLSLDADGDIWIGMSDHFSEGTFRWVTGRAIELEDPHWQISPARQPNDSGGAEDCGEMNAGAVWNDNGCSFSQTFVCECDGIAQPTPPTWCLTGTLANCDQCGDACGVGELCSSAQSCES